MGSNDIPPPHCPAWVLPASVLMLGIGGAMWSATYVAMTLRSMRTKSYSMPLFALSVNVSWELIYAFYVSEAPFERFGFTAWLFLDIGLVYTTVRYGQNEWTHAPVVGRHIGKILAVMTLVCAVGHYAFAVWWLSVPGRGFGDKTGRSWGGKDGYDSTEAAFWSASVAQIPLSAGSLAMLVVRGHSGGASYPIWLLRTLGSFIGLYLNTAMSWYYWPEANGYFVNPFALFLVGTSVACDAAYPFVLRWVRQSEVELSDGRLVRGDTARLQTKKAS